MKEKTRYRKISTLITLIIAGETIFFLPFVMARIFRPTLLSVFEISNTELGFYFSIYGIVAMVSYVFGGTLADRFPARNLMSLALWLTSIGGFVMISIPSSKIMAGIYAFWGFTTIFLFWAAMIRATREWGGEGFQGRAFGWLEGGRGGTAALIGTVVFLLFSILSPGENEAETLIQGTHAFQYVIFAVSMITFLCGFLVWLFIPGRKPVTNDNNVFSSSRIFALLKLPTIWLLALLIICAYSGYKITDDFSLYAREVLGFSEVSSAAVGTGALWVRGLVAVFAGILADRFSGVKLISISYMLIIAGGIMIASGILESVAILALLNLLFAVIGIYALRALYFAVLKEARIPLGLTGTAVGIMSFIGYTPEVFMSPWMGHLLDSHPGPAGHQYVFWVLSGFGVLGFLVSVVFRKSAETTNMGG
jgi:MFS family permease